MAFQWLTFHLRFFFKYQILELNFESNFRINIGLVPLPVEGEHSIEVQIVLLGSVLQHILFHNLVGQDPSVPNPMVKCHFRLLPKNDFSLILDKLFYRFVLCIRLVLHCIFARQISLFGYPILVGF